MDFLPVDEEEEDRVPDPDPEERAPEKPRESCPDIGEPYYWN